MITNDDVITKIINSIGDIEASRSYHWKLQQNDYDETSTSFKGAGPVGTYSTKTGLVTTIGHRVLQFPFLVMGMRYRRFFEVRSHALAITARQKRQCDLDMLRQVLSLSQILEYADFAGPGDALAVIGDGYGNMASLLTSMFPQRQVIIVNLNKTLLIDLKCLRAAHPSLTLGLLQSQENVSEALEPGAAQLIAIQADNSSLLAHMPLALAINIESMMEMESATISAYFHSLRTNPGKETLFYCNNRPEKRWGDGTIIRFADYPWDEGDQILLDGDCPWTRYRYSGRPPFYVRRNLCHHRLVKMARAPA